MSLLIKICGLRNTDDVAAAVAAGANAVGFVFAESVRRVTPAEARLACADLPPDIKRVAVMLHPTQKELYGVWEEFEPDVVQTDVEDFRDVLVPTSVEQWPVIREGNVPQKMPSTFLYEGAQSGQGKTVDWKRAQLLAHRGRMILAGGLSPGNVATAIQHVRPYGVDVSSGVESEPGVKDADKISQFVSAVRAAEKNL